MSSIVLIAILLIQILVFEGVVQATGFVLGCLIGIGSFLLAKGWRIRNPFSD